MKSMRGLLPTLLLVLLPFVARAQQPLPAQMPAWMQSPTWEELQEVGLPLVEIVTIDGEEPTCDYISPPEGISGLTIDNATKVPGRLRKWVHGEVVYDSGDYEEDVSGMRIKIRGNTSAYEPKKPFKVKLEKKADLLCRGDNDYKDKEWVLMKDDYDIDGDGLLHLMIGLEVGRRCGMSWEPQAEFVNLMINGDYRGVYMLCESIKRGKTRIDVDKDTGFVIERDPYWWKEDLSFSTYRHQMHYTFKYPESEDVTTQQVDETRTLMDEVEKAIWYGCIDTLIDIENTASWLMAHDILGTWDAAGSNIFVYKYDDSPESKLKMGPLWDFGSIMWMKGEWSNVHIGETFYFHYLLEMAAWENLPFIEAYQELWEKRGCFVIDEMLDFLTAFLASDEAEALQTCNVWDMARWEHLKPSVEEVGQKAITWFRERKEWLSEKVLPMGIGGVRQDQRADNDGWHDRYYDLGGAPATGTAKGFHIKVGQQSGRQRAVKMFNIR